MAGSPRDGLRSPSARCAKLAGSPALREQRELCRLHWRFGPARTARRVRGPIRAPLRARGAALAVLAPAAQRGGPRLEQRLAADPVDQRARLPGELRELLGRTRRDQRAALTQVAPDEPHRPVRPEARADADLVQRELAVLVDLGLA